LEGKKLNENILLTIVELGASVLIEGILLSWIFSHLQSKAQSKMETKLRDEMSTMEKQTKFDYEQLQMTINSVKSDIIAEIKESNQNAKPN
jgi:hypothetical protein